MRVMLTGDTLIDVKFRREERGYHPSGRGFRSVIRSHCRISRVIDPNGKGGDNYVVLAEGFVTRNHNDAPSKAEGFRKALEKTLDSYLLRLPLDSRANRELIWKEFLKMYGDRL